MRLFSFEWRVHYVNILTKDHWSDYPAVTMYTPSVCANVPANGNVQNVANQLVRPNLKMENGLLVYPRRTVCIAVIK